MKKLAIICCFISLKLYAQVELKFDKSFIDSEEKWVAIKTANESNYIYGFVYFDTQAGLTLNVEGQFTIDSNNYNTKKNEKFNLKKRIEPTNVLVALIPENKFTELNIKSTPDWLLNYKQNEESVDRLFNKGFMYNAWNDCEKALTYLLKVKDKNPKFKSLNVELAFSYNCLADYTKAAEILEEEIKLHPTDAYTIKEYIFAISKTKNIEKATALYFKTYNILADKTFNAENCFNIMQYFYTIKDKPNFNLWYGELAKCTNDNKMITNYADKMKNEINQ